MTSKIIWTKTDEAPALATLCLLPIIEAYTKGLALDPRTLTMHYINAGHPAGLVRRGDELLRLPATSHPVGYFDEAHFQTGTFQFTSVDRFLLYTDGLINCTNQQEEMFGAKRLDEAFRSFCGDHMLFLDRLFAEIDQFQAGQSSFDDCTAVVMDFHKRSVEKESL